MVHGSGYQVRDFITLHGCAREQLTMDPVLVVPNRTRSEANRRSDGRHNLASRVEQMGRGMVELQRPFAIQPSIYPIHVYVQ